MNNHGDGLRTYWTRRGGVVLDRGKLAEEEAEEPPPRGAAALFDDWGL